MHRVLILVLCFMMVAVVAFGEKPSDSAKYTTEPAYPAAVDRDYFEGFETAVPPAGWTTLVTNPSYTWHQSTLSFYQGTASAECVYDPALVYQDEWLYFQYTIGPGEDHLNFAAMASYYWTVDPYQNYNIKVTVNGTTVWDFVTDHSTDVNYEWAVYDVDLSAYTGQTVTIGFGYQGSDGAQACIDAVGINGGYTPPPPPEGDVCETAFPIPSGDFTIIGTNVGFNNDYPLDSGSCTGYSASGQDVVYYTNLDVGDEFTVTMDTDTDWDDSIYMITDCGDPMGSCVVGADDYPDMSTFTYIATEAGTYYLIVSAYGSGQGGYTIYGFNGGSVTPVETATWGSVKTLYR
jgi:hypothetical protein